MAGKVATLTTGPYRGVRYVPEPNVGNNGSLLYYATNMYLADPQSGAGVYARPGFLRPTEVSTSGEGQGVTSLTMLDGTIYNFMFVAGKVLRWSTNLSSAPTDVTPTNVTIGTTGFIYAVAMNDQLIVSDGVNKMWVGTNLGSTPITATVIEQQTPATILSIGSNDVRLANTAFTGTWSGTQATFAANATGTAVGALGQIAIGTWGIILVEATSSSALAFTAAFNAGAGYASQALAIAALPARTAGRRYVGYVTVQADAGAVWIAGTDAFAGGTTGNQAQTTNYYAGEGAAYSVFGQPVIYYGAIFVIYQQIAATYARTTIGWSEPNEPAVGYQQTDYDNQWTLTQTSTQPLYVLLATNDALYYARAYSWGAVSGAPGVNFQGTATHDIVSGNVGCTTPRSAALYLNYAYFMDAVGRPYRFAVGGAPEPIWQQARIVTESVNNPVSATINMGWGVLEPNLNAYLVTRVVGGAGAPAVTLDAYDADTGIYMGGWATTGAFGYKAGGLVRDASGTPAFCFLERGDTVRVYVWYLTRTFSNVWTDNSSGVSVSFTTPWQAYTGAQTVTLGEGRVLMNAEGAEPSAVVRYRTTSAAITSVVSRSVLSGTPNDTTGRLVLPTGLANPSRGVQMEATVSNEQTVQWRVWGTEIDLTDAGRATVTDY